VGGLVVGTMLGGAIGGGRGDERGLWGRQVTCMKLSRRRRAIGATDRAELREASWALGHSYRCVLGA